MKKKSVSIHIDNPCSENWDDMTEGNEGKFCKNCCHTVTDFTHLSDREIIAFLSKNKGNICGRFTEQQLMQPFIDNNTTSKSWNSIWMAGLLLLGVADFAFAAPPLKPTIEWHSDYHESKEDYDEPKNDSTYKTLQGQIVDESDKSVIKNAHIYITNTKIGTYSDEKGYFKLKVPNKKTQTITLTVRAAGFALREITVQKRDLPLTNTIALKKESFIMGRICLPAKSKK